MPTTAQPPSYRLYKRTGQAVVTIDGKDHYLGKYGSRSSRKLYDELIARWLAHGRKLPASDEVEFTVNELLIRFYRHCKHRYAHRQSLIKRLSVVRSALRPAKQLYGSALAGEFGPKALMHVREQFIDQGMARKTINERIQVIKACFRWGVREELLSPSVHHALSTVEGLRAGESKASEPNIIRPVSDTDVEAVLQHVLPPVRAMIELQLVTGMRPGEVCAMRTGDIDVTNRPWIYRPRTHKSQFRGIEKEIFVGERGQRILRPFLRPNFDEYIFRPDEAIAKRRAERHAKRKTPITCGNRPGSKRMKSPVRAPRDHYDVQSYRQAIHRACDKVGVDRWGPHQLRHSFATRIRKLHGAEAARICLGHQHLKTAEIYAERDAEVAASVARKHG